MKQAHAFPKQAALERGNVSLEYAFLVLLILLVAFVGIARLGAETSEMMEDPELQSAIGG